MNTIMLTTDDNPYNPWTQYDEWYQWDVEHGYNLTNYIARIYDELNDDPYNLENEDIWEDAKVSVLDMNIYGNIIGVSKHKDYEDIDEYSA